MYICKKCNKSFKSELALRGHSRVHSDNYEEVQKLHTERLHQMADEKISKNTNKYYKDPKYCLACNKIIPYEKTTWGKYSGKFCNHSCSATYNNTLRSPQTQETKTKRNNSLYATLLKKPGSRKISTGKLTLRVVNIFSRAYFSNALIGDYSKIFTMTCQHCNVKFSNRLKVKYCNQHSDMYKNNNRNRYAFTFPLSKYPDLFGHMYEQLKKYGMWNTNNKNGLSRDHRISVNEAIRKNYDPFYIRHPLNCELMPWIDNNKKKTKSSLSYIALKKLVDEYESST